MDFSLNFVPDVADVLESMADYLDNIGWKQGGHGNDGGPRCLIGSLESALDGVTSRDDGSIYTMGISSFAEAHTKVMAYFSRWLDKNHHHNSPIAWNDGVWTKKIDVVNGLREAAADWRLEHE